MSCEPLVKSLTVQDTPGTTLVSSWAGAEKTDPVRVASARIVFAIIVSYVTGKEDGEVSWRFWRCFCGGETVQFIDLFASLPVVQEMVSVLSSKIFRSTMEYQIIPCRLVATFDFQIKVCNVPTLPLWAGPSFKISDVAWNFQFCSPFSIGIRRSARRLQYER